MTVRIFALTSRGLEPVAADEMARLPGLQVGEISYRRITANFTGELADLLNLRTVDDIFLDLATWEGIAPQRSSLEALKKLGEQLDILPALDIISAIRSIRRLPSFSITVNFVGRRNYTTDEIKAAVAEGLTRRYTGEYTSEAGSQINVRIFIEHQRAYAGLRLGENALHRRRYKRTHVPGSLKPTVAAAMLRIAEISPGQPVIDACCGAGTILIEAALQGSPAIGGDIQAEVLKAAKTNAGFAGVPVHVHLWDAQRLPLASRSVGLVVTNLPWGRQVAADENLAALYRNTCREFERVLDSRGQVVLLTNLPQLVQLERLEKKTEMEISLFGMNPTLMQFSSFL